MARVGRRGKKPDPQPGDDLGFDESLFIGDPGELSEAPPEAMIIEEEWVQKQQVEPEAPAEQQEALSESDELEEPVAGQLAVDIFESKEHLFVRARVAGVRKEDLNVSLSDNVLTISGKLFPDDQEVVTSYHAQECYWGDFIRTIALPVQVKEEEISADLKEGVLTIRFVKVKQDIVRKITIN